MAFEGDITNLAMGDVFQTLAMTRQAGTLHLRGREERSVAFGPNGVAVLSKRDSLGEWLGRFLVGNAMVADEQLTRAAKLKRRNRDMWLGDLLLDAGAVSEEDLKTAGRYLAQEELFDLFGWVDGKFEFLPGEPETDAPFSQLWFDVGGIAMEAARRMDETERMAEHISPTDVLIAIDAEGVDQLSQNGQRLLPLLDGSRTVEGVVEDSFLGQFDTLKAVSTMIEHGVVRQASLDEITDAAQGAVDRKQFLRAAKLFELACELSPDTETMRQNAAFALQRAGEKRAAAEQLVQLGNLCREEGKVDAALDAYRRAARLDNQNASAQAGLMISLFEQGDVDPGITAARTAASTWIALGEFQKAMEVAGIGLEHAPGDVTLRLSIANAQLSAGDTDMAMEQLEELAAILETTGEDDRKLLEVYKRILSLDGSRREVARRVEEIQAYARAKRKRIVQRLAVVVGVVLVGLLAVPLLTGPGFEDRILDIDGLIAKGEMAKAGLLIKELQAEDLDEDESMALLNRLTQLNPAAGGGGGQTPANELAARLEPRYANAMKKIQVHKHFDALQEYLATLDFLESPATPHPSGTLAQIPRFKAEWGREAHDALSAVAVSTAEIAAEVAEIRIRFHPDELRKAESEKMRELVKLAARVRELREGDNWNGLEAAVEAICIRAGKPKDRSNLKITEATIRVLTDSDYVLQQEGVALSHVRKYDLEKSYRESRNEVTRMLTEGDIPSAVDVWKDFLKVCEALRGYEPADLYDPIRKTYLENLDLDGRVEGFVATYENVLETEREAAQALAEGDFSTAWELRALLVSEHPEIRFDERFWLPLTVQTFPPGAELYLLGGSAAGRKVGTSPQTVHCPLTGTTRFAIRMEGYREHVIERYGAADERGGVETVDLEKIPLIENRPAAPHTTQAPVGFSATHLYLAGRDGVLRSLERKRGTDTGRFATKMLAGMAGAPAVAGDTVHMGALDGFAFVLKAVTLEEIARVELGGPVRCSPIAVEGGAIYLDESGIARRLDNLGNEVWKRETSKVRMEGMLAGDRLYVTTVDGELLGIDVDTGDVDFRVALTPNNPLWGPPVIDGQFAYVGCDNYSVACVDLKRRKIVWTEKMSGPVIGRVAVTGNRLVVATRRGALYTLDRSNGQRVARTLLGGDILSGVLTLPDGHAAVTEGGMVWRFDAKGEVRWRYNLGELVSAPLRFSEGAILIVSRRGRLVALSP